MNDEFGTGFNVDEEPPAAFLGSSSGARTMADGTLRVTIDFTPADALGAFTAFGAPGSAVAAARVFDEVAVEHGRPKAVKEWGQEAKALWKSSFFRTLAVWEAIGTDAEYLEWVKRQPSAISGDFSEYHDDGEAYCMPAHIRRVELGSGTAVKPPYAAIPLTNEEHQRSHQHGDTNLRPDEWWDKMRIKYLHAWCWETAKIQINEENSGHHLPFESFGMIPPKIVEGWAMRRNIQRFLPNLYKGHVNGEAEVHQEADDS